jgi:choline kinase
MIKNAIILAAGLGSRLKPLTDEIPKCLTEINGQPIILKTMKALEQNGVSDLLIVVGYLGQVIIDTLGHRLGNMKIQYIFNDIYDETNSMYSAWLAKDLLINGSYLIEGDTIFDEEIIENISQTDDSDNYWVVDKFTAEHNGSMSITDQNGRIKEIKIIRQQLEKYEDNFYKSAGLLKLSAQYGNHFSKWLDEEVAINNVKVYYDLVIEKHLEELAIKVFDVRGARWQEI